jgi:hypothetical protein
MNSSLCSGCQSQVSLDYSHNFLERIQISMLIRAYHYKLLVAAHEDNSLYCTIKLYSKVHRGSDIISGLDHYSSIYSRVHTSRDM